MIKLCFFVYDMSNNNSLCEHDLFQLMQLIKDPHDKEDSDMLKYTLEKYIAKKGK